MCFGIALPIDALPEELVLQHQHRVALYAVNPFRNIEKWS
jgi:hypothetical protein